MSDIDAPSGLLERLGDLEADLARLRAGRKPSPRIDLKSWTPRQPANDSTPLGPIEALKQSLRDDWKGFNEALARWAAQVDERFARR